MTGSAPDRPKIPIYLGRNAEGEITSYTIMAKTKNEEKQTGENTKSTKKKNLIIYSFSFVEENYNQKRLQNKIQTAISGTERP